MKARLDPRSALVLLASLLGLAASCSPIEESPPPPANETIALGEKAARVPHRQGPAPPERTESAPIRAWGPGGALGDRVALFDTVFWDPRDSISLRELIAQTPLVKDKVVLEIGTGSGLISLYALKFGARKVVATDVNPLAVANARYNADRMGFADRFEARLVPLDDADAYSVMGDSERFDLVLSNPPWEDAKPEHISHYAFYDPSFRLLQTLLEGLPQHLNPGGKALLVYGAADGIRELRRISEENGFRVRILDDRDPETLPRVFVPGMLLEVSP